MKLGKTWIRRITAEGEPVEALKIVGLLPDLAGPGRLRVIVRV